MDDYINWGLFDNSSLFPSVNLDDSASVACGNPNEICGQNFVNINPPTEMATPSKVNLRKFSGYPSDDPDRFLSEFTAYCVFNRITEEDPRKLAAFQLHLLGPAQTWYTCLEEHTKAQWATLKEAFEGKYSSANNKPVLLVETEQFQNIRLQPAQQIEDYYSKVIENGRKLSKSPQEVLLKFIQGLPSQLAFFVRAGNPEDVHSAVTSAKMGEAYGYRSTQGQGQPNLGTVAAAAPKDSDKIRTLENSLQDLTNKLDKLLMSKCDSSNHIPTPRNTNSRVCYSCNAPGHVKRSCNLGRGFPDPSAQCQICAQFGHVARNCKMFVDKRDQSGNANYPRNTGRGPLGGHQ